MSLFNSLISTVASGLVQDTNGDGKIQAVELIQQLLQQNGGNLGTLLGQLQQSSLGNAVETWIGNGENAQIDANQVQNALGEHLNQAATNLGLSSNQASSVLAQYLPQIINTLTPNGTVADTDGFGMDDIARIVMQQFFK